MKLFPLLLFLCVWLPPSYGSDENTRRGIVVKLSRQDIASIMPGHDTSREAFDKDWGQFEVRIPKKRFPVPAPNCRKNVILRMPGVAPNVRGRDKQLQHRWQQFQSLHELWNGRLDNMELRIASGPYMRADKRGGLVLQYCNAYIAP